MEAIHEFELTDFLVTVAVDSKGRSIHRFAQDPVAATSAGKV
jgi:fumarate hydratase class I